MKRTTQVTVTLLALVLGLTLVPATAAAQRRKPTAKPAPAAPASQPADPRLLELERAFGKLQREHEAVLRRVKELEAKGEEQALETLRGRAESEAAAAGDVVKQADAEKDTSKRVFQGGERSLQALNPEISIVGDAFGKAILGRREYASDADRSGFVFRTVGLHLQSDLDPYSFAKVCVGLTPKGLDFGEAYMTWTSLATGLSLTVGKFRQEFGVVNRWHVPGLDQVDFPLALRTVLGPEGLNQVGLSLEWLMPRLWAHTNQLVLQVTNGQNDHLFAGSFASIPAVLLRVKSYYDLTESTYFELGLTGMLGWNNKRGVADETTGTLVDEPRQSTWVYGADWTLQWEPLKQARYRNFVLRGELYGVHKSLPGQDLSTMGLYQYAQARLSQQWEVGARFDWTMPFETGKWGWHTYDIQPYVTWWQSPWVRARLLYSYTTGDTLARDDHRVLLQVTFSAGPHKHERY
jgi:hypothetical protein